MIDRVLDILSGRAAPVLAKPAGRRGGQDDELQLAVAALLVEAARMADDFDAAERATIERLLAEKFRLAPVEVAQLLARAEQAVQDSSQIFPFTREICERISHDERGKILEMLWTVAYADGVLDPYEDMLLRRIAGLIHVTDRERGEARQRALEQIAAAKAATRGAV